MAIENLATEFQVFAFDDLPKERAGTTYWRAAARGDSSTIGINWFEPGHPAWPLHDHPFDQIVLVLQGRMRITVAGRDHIMVAPSVAWIPADVPHAGNVHGDEPCLNIDIFGVVREDFLHLTGYLDDARAVARAGS